MGIESSRGRRQPDGEAMQTRLGEGHAPRTGRSRREEAPLAGQIEAVGVHLGHSGAQAGSRVLRDQGERPGTGKRCVHAAWLRRDLLLMEAAWPRRA